MIHDQVEQNKSDSTIPCCASNSPARDWIAQTLNLSASISVPHWYFSKMNTYLHEANIYFLYFKLYFMTERFNYF